MSSSDSCSRETSSDDPEGGGGGGGRTGSCLEGNGLTVHFKEKAFKKTIFLCCGVLKSHIKHTLPPVKQLLYFFTTLRSIKALTVGVITKSRVKEDAGFLLGLLGHFDCQVQILNPLPHLHFRAETINTQSDLTQTERQKVLCIHSIDRETIKKIGKCTQLNKIHNSVFMHSDVEMLYIKHLAVHDMN